MANANKFSSFGQGILQVLGRKQAAEQAHKELMLSLTLPMKFKAQQAELERKAKYRDALLRYSEEKKAQDREATLRREIEANRNAMSYITTLIKAQNGDGEEGKVSSLYEVQSYADNLQKEFAVSKESKDVLNRFNIVQEFIGMSDDEKRSQSGKGGLFEDLYKAWDKGKTDVPWRKTKGSLLMGEGLRVLNVSKTAMQDAFKDQGKKNVADQYATYLTGMEGAPASMVSQTAAGARQNISQQFDMPGFEGVSPPEQSQVNPNTAIDMFVEGMYETPSEKPEEQQIEEEFNKRFGR